MVTEKRIFFVIIILVGLIGSEAQVLSPEDEYFYGHEADRYDWSKHPCRRTCRSNEKPRKCHYVFVVEIFSTMSKACYNCPFNITDCYRPHCIPADGAQKSIYVANRQLPGPTIEVCKNDEIIVDVRNAMLAESTSIHWHGIEQTGTPYMDGVVHITQCPIPPGDSFRYVFKAANSGTYFWHSHMGYQRDDGLSGPLIIHSPLKENPHRKLYDYDNHVMLINDWLDSETNDVYVKDLHAGSRTRANTILINGMGCYYNKVERDNETSQCTPTTVFQVKKNFKYRFRLINAGATDCPIQISIDNHTMLIISMDANDIESVEVDSLYIWIGERVDFVVKANQEIGNYWIRYRGLDQCDKELDIRVHQVAILRYDSAAPTNPKSPVGYDIHITPENGRILNPGNNGTEDPNAVSIPLLTALARNDEANTRKPDHQFYIAYNFYELDNYNFHRRHLYGFYQVAEKFKEYTLQLNHISLKIPSSPLLSQGDLIMSDTLCNSTTMADKNCTVNECACTHVLQVKLNSIVELVIIDEGVYSRGAGNNSIHPLHLHGYFFRVIAMERINEQISVDLVKKLDHRGKIKRHLDHAPLKDTVKVPTNGYTIVRFHAKNPGYWLYHCHIDHHMNIGMALIFQVGEHEDFPPVPKGFPKCGNY